MDSATWCRTLPAAASAARRLRPEVSKNSSTALSSNEGELARSITTCAPAMASLSPLPVMVLTPVFGAVATASCPFCLSFSTTFDPIKPVRFPGWLRRSPQHDASLFTSASGRATTRSNIGLLPAKWSRPPGSEQLPADERDRLVERGAARTGVPNRGVLVPDRHAAEEDEPVRG